MDALCLLRCQVMRKYMMHQFSNNVDALYLLHCQVMRKEMLHFK